MWNMSFPTLIDFALKAGVPSALGVFIVWYLLHKFIPSQQALFRSEMEASRAAFRDALASEQKTHSDLMGRVVDTVTSEGQQTRASIDRLNETTLHLTEVVYQMSGKVIALDRTGNTTVNGR
jgi:hypothetical protein